MKWPDIERQPAGSDDCTFYAMAYAAKLCGHDVSPEWVRGWCAETKMVWSRYLMRVYGCWYEWDEYHGGRDFHMRHFISYGSSKGFKEWCLAYLGAGYVGLAGFPLSDRLHHAVVLLDGNGETVTMADPIRGIVEERWDRFALGQVLAWLDPAKCKEAVAQ